jgi:hypothetical protein
LSTPMPDKSSNNHRSSWVPKSQKSSKDSFADLGSTGCQTPEWHSRTVQRCLRLHRNSLNRCSLGVRPLLELMLLHRLQRYHKSCLRSTLLGCYLNNMAQRSETAGVLDRRGRFEMHREAPRAVARHEGGGGDGDADHVKRANPTLRVAESAARLACAHLWTPIVRLICGRTSCRTQRSKRCAIGLRLVDRSL